ncbi:hypothetical protein SDC9_144132 [bioreactor metagenome]|uniref:Uncharacterized protein n=1 Tax=bioreactor metagenome TaxID=1076179 RepID=A0A645E8K4_9ZZZZ
MILVGIFVATIVVMIQRFYKNLLSDEGYLMFTLPTKPWKHITSKLLVSLIWLAVSGIMAIISILIIAYDKIFTFEAFIEMKKAIEAFYDYLGASGNIVIIEGLLAIIIGIISNVLIIYASIAIGHLFNKHKVLASLGALIGLNTISQIILTIISLIPGAILFPGNISSTNDINAILPYIHTVAWLAIIFSLVLSAGYFVITNYILSKHLNLE